VGHFLGQHSHGPRADGVTRRQWMITEIDNRRRRLVLLLLFGLGVVAASCTSTTRSSSPPTSIAPTGGTATTAPTTSGALLTKQILNDSGIGSGASRTFTVTGRWTLNWNFDCSRGRGTGSLKVVGSGSSVTTSPAAVVGPHTDVSWGTSVSSSSTGTFEAVTTLSSSCSWSVEVRIPT
jgi:hypothetical protein